MPYPKPWRRRERNVLKYHALLIHIVLLLLGMGEAHAQSGPEITLGANTEVVAAYDIYELTMANPATYGNPWDDPAISAVFTSPTHTTNTVHGFYYAAHTWKLRFAPRQAGNWIWTLTVTDSSGTCSRSGGFTGAISNNSGFLRPNPLNPFGFVTESDGRPFHASGNGVHLTRPPLD